MEVDQPVGTFEIDVLEAGGQTLARGRVVVQPGGFARQNIRVSKQTQGLSPMPGEMEAIGALKNALTSQRFWQRPFVSPTPDCLNGRFGVKRYHNGVYSGNYHKGVDLRAPLGRPVLATAGGTVEIAKMFRLHGGTVGLDHGQGVASIYIHLSRLGVQPGQRVQAGSVIGWVGATGFANGPHLHWGLYVHGLPVNPEQWTPPVKACL
jgi:murein DD-endopeptidase MepM/ murein hydrolase activator NlpD